LKSPALSKCRGLLSCYDVTFRRLTANVLPFPYFAFAGDDALLRFDEGAVEM